jgi:hypothetical protein
MIGGIFSHHGDPRARGLAYGRRFRAAIHANLAGFSTAARAAGWSWDSVREAVRAQAQALRPSRNGEIEAMAAGAGVSSESLLAYNLFRHRFSPDECTVMMAVGSASATGSTAFMKNSDKIGSDSLVGDGFHNHKEVNVVVDLRSDSGRRIVGVAAAGSTGLKMGLNDAGVAAGSNIARTVQLRDRRVDVTKLRALDRGQILRDGLEFGTAQEATEWAVSAVIERPTDTPGNVEFADAQAAYVVEGSYEHWAVEEIRDRVAARTNMFVLLKSLNDPDDRSSQLRHRRCRELLEPLEGRVEISDLHGFSQDHENGPGLDSICRHSEDHRDETSLSALVAAIDGENPARSQVQIALGKPCWAWSQPQGVLTITMDEPPEAIPDRFRSGDIWRELYREEVRAG